MLSRDLYEDAPERAHQLVSRRAKLLEVVIGGISERRIKRIRHVCSLCDHPLAQISINSTPIMIDIARHVSVTHL